MTDTKSSPAKILQMLRAEISKQEEDEFTILNYCYAELERLLQYEKENVRKNRWNDMLHFRKRDLVDGQVVLFKISYSDEAPVIIRGIVRSDVSSSDKNYDVFISLTPIQEIERDQSVYTELGFHYDTNHSVIRSVGSLTNYGDITWHGFKTLESMM